MVFTLSFPGPHHPYDLEGTKYADMYELNDMEFSESTYEDLEQKGLNLEIWECILRFI